MPDTMGKMPISLPWVPVRGQLHSLSHASRTSDLQARPGGEFEVRPRRGIGDRHRLSGKVGAAAG